MLDYFNDDVDIDEDSAASFAGPGSQAAALDLLDSIKQAILDPEGLDGGSRQTQQAIAREQPPRSSFAAFSADERQQVCLTASKMIEGLSDQHERLYRAIRDRGGEADRLSLDYDQVIGSVRARLLNNPSEAAFAAGGRLLADLGARVAAMHGKLPKGSVSFARHDDPADEAELARLRNMNPTLRAHAAAKARGDGTASFDGGGDTAAEAELDRLRAMNPTLRALRASRRAEGGVPRPAA